MRMVWSWMWVVAQILCVRFFLFWNFVSNTLYFVTFDSRWNPIDFDLFFITVSFAIRWNSSEKNIFCDVCVINRSCVVYEEQRIEKNRENTRMRIFSIFGRKLSFESLTLTPRLAIASLSNCTTSSPTTSEQLKPLVHWTSKPFVKPSCRSGNEKVKPNGNRSAYTLCSCTKIRVVSQSVAIEIDSIDQITFMKFDKHSAMWSNNWTPLPNIIFCGIA